MRLISIIIPCYNESENIGRLVDSLRTIFAELLIYHRIELILIDDASTDDTYSRLLNSQHFFADVVDVLVVHNEVNKGLGGSLRVGFDLANGDIIVTVDADGAYDFQDMPLMLYDFKDKELDVLVASPYAIGGGIENVPSYRLMLSKVASKLYRILLRSDVTCYTSLLRVYKAEVVKSVEFTNNNHMALAELLVGVLLKRYNVADYPTVLHGRIGGQSSMKILRTVKDHLRLMVKTFYRVMR